MTLSQRSVSLGQSAMQRVTHCVTSVAATLFCVASGIVQASTSPCETIVLPLDETLRAPSSFGQRFARDVALFQLRAVAPGARAMQDDFQVGCETVDGDAAERLRRVVDTDG